VASLAIFRTELYLPWTTEGSWEVKGRGKQRFLDEVVG
jgi:hypothetical protein